jgi:TonB family protein
MAPLPPLTPPPPGTPGSRVRVRTRSTIVDEIVAGSTPAEIILAKLRGMIARGGQETEIILGTIAVAAHALTGANGAAIAMPQNGVVVCVGRSGDIAPELGDLLNVDSGISGECLRTGTMMRCDDASRDFHVNAEVCRQMGLQSIAVVPLRGRYGRVGVLETFSAQSYAFNEEHMSLLGRLAGLAEAAWAQGPEAQELGTPSLGEESAVNEQESVGEVLAAGSVAEEENLHTHPLAIAPPALTAPMQGEVLTNRPRMAAASAALARVGEAIATGLHSQLRTERRWRYGTIAGLATVLVILLAVLSWKIWYKASLPTQSAASPPGTVSKSPDSAAGVGLAWEAGVDHPVSQSTSEQIPITSVLPSSTAPAAQATKSLAGAKPLDTTSRRKLLVQGAPDRGETTTVSAEAPEMPASDRGPTGLSLPPASAALPRLTVPISQGVSGGALLQRVIPVYPLEARQLHVQGTVVLEATINEQGLIENLRVISGSPLLSKSALDAVRKWRYSPYLLNGKPIAKDTQINITFIP